MRIDAVRFGADPARPQLTETSFARACPCARRDKDMMGYGDFLGHVCFTAASLAEVKSGDKQSFDLQKSDKHNNGCWKEGSKLVLRLNMK